MKQKHLFKQSEIVCEHCGKNLLEDPQRSMFVLWRTDETTPEGCKFYQKAYYCCKGECDSILKEEALDEGFLTDGWYEMDDFTNPVIFIRTVLEWITLLNDGQKMTDEVYDKLTTLLWNCYLENARDLTPEEEEKLEASF